MGSNFRLTMPLSPEGGLATELVAAFERVEQREGHLRFAARLGIPGQALYAVGGLGRAKIKTTTGFDFDEQGFEAVVIGAYDVLGPGLDASDLVDLVAFTASEPTRWWTRRNAADVLGVEALVSAASLPHLKDNPHPLLVSSNPLAWLRAGCKGVCLLTPEIGFHNLYGVPSLAFDDEGFGDRIRQLMTRQQFATPRFLLREQRIAA